MKAIMYSRFGSPEGLELKEIPKPTPRDHEVLIKVYATTVTAGDWRARTRNLPRGFGLIARLFFGFSRPRQPILGSELSEREPIGHERRGVARLEERQLLLSHAEREIGAQLAEQRAHPRPGAEDQPAGAVRSVMRAHLHAVARGPYVLRRITLLDRRAPAASLGGECGDATIGGEEAVVGLIVPHGVFRQGERGDTPHDLVAVHRLERDAGGLVRRADAVEHERVRRAEVEPARLEQQ